MGEQHTQYDRNKSLLDMIKEQHMNDMLGKEGHELENYIGGCNCT